MRRLVPLLLLAVLPAVALAPTPSAQEDPSASAPARQLPPRTDAGTWDGTWFYVSRDARIALWIRTVDGRPEVKLRYMSSATPEMFETGWDGKATYTLSGVPATFDLSLPERDANQMSGTWDWSLVFPDSARLEKGTVRLYRSGDGRGLVLAFDTYARTLRRGDEERTSTRAPAWTFRKASKRLVLWDEIPF